MGIRDIAVLQGGHTYVRTYASIHMIMVHAYMYMYSLNNVACWDMCISPAFHVPTIVSSISPLFLSLLLPLIWTEALDFVAPTDTIVIQSNTTQYDLKVKIINDAIREGAEEFEVVIFVSGSGMVVTVISMGITTARVAIIDDDCECAVTPCDLCCVNAVETQYCCIFTDTLDTSS